MIEMGPAGGRSFDFEKAGASPKKAASNASVGKEQGMDIVYFKI